MRTLAIDYGTRRIGLAMSDDGGRFATPFAVLENETSAEKLAHIVALVGAEQVQRIVIGLPLNMDDSVGSGARAVVQWARDLRSRATCPLVFVDERLSSFDAEQSLARRRRDGEKLTHRMKKDRRDALAAASFLQDFLDGKLNAIDVGL